MSEKKEGFSAPVSRRNFLKTMGLGTAAVTAFTIVPRFVLGGDGYVPPSDKLYIAGIGVGGKGESDLTGFAGSPDGKVKSLHSTRPQQGFRPGTHE